MAFTIQEIDHIPPRRNFGGPRETPCMEVVRQASAALHKMVSVTSDSEDELQKLYSSMIQWIGRHPDQRVNVKKDKENLYVSITPSDEKYVCGRRRMPTAQ